MNEPQHNYIKILESLKERIRQARFKAAYNVSVELLKLYWEIGNTIIEQQKIKGWGAKIVDKLSIDLKTEFPDFKGVSVRNLKYMKAFAEAYPLAFTIVQPAAAQLQNGSNKETELVQPLVALIPWTHHIVILNKVKKTEERFFYIEKTAHNGWSKTVLSLQIDSKLNQRQGNAITNFNTTLPALQSDLANETLKSPYVFDFLSFSEELKERELEKALIQHLKAFMLELGRGFAYAGNQKNINVQGDDFFIDLLFYNYHLHCFVVFELKVGDFKPEFAGKLNFYVNTINEQVKGIGDKPTIGVLLCKTPNKTVIKYALEGIKSPIGIANYELAQSLPKQLKGEIPTVEELEAEIDKEYEELKSPSQKRFDALKEKISQSKEKEMTQPSTIPILIEIFDKSLLPLYQSLLKRMEDFKDLFLNYYPNWQAPGPNITINHINQLAEYWRNEIVLRNRKDFYFTYHLNGFTKAGTEAFDISFQLEYKIDQYWYGFILINYKDNKPIIKKLYREQLTSKEIEEIVDIVYNFVLDRIERGMDIM